MRTKWVVIVLAAVILFCGICAIGQETRGTIAGFVKDSTGAVIPNVTVVIQNQATALERRVTSGADGEYVSTLLPVGTYQITVEHSGFKKVVIKDLVLNVNDHLRVDIPLQVGMVTEAVTVEAAVPAVQTESSTVGSVLQGNRVLSIPLNGRSLYSLLSLQPGITAGSGMLSGRVGYGLDNTHAINVNGARSAENNFMLDGADNNDTGSNLSLINFISIDSVQEFRILRGNYDAQFGRSGGGQINVITKGGGNQFHGAAYEFFRNDVLDARPYKKPTCDSIAATGGRVLKGTNCGTPLLRYHDFGGTIGGPIKKDKLFFFFSEEVRRVRQVRGTGVINTRVPTDAQKNGDFSAITGLNLRDPLLAGACTATDKTACFPGNVIPAGRIDPSAKALLSLWPVPNSTPAVLGGNNNFTVSTPSSRNYREELLRLDYNATEKHRIYARMVQDTIPATNAFNEVFGTSNADVPGIYSDITKSPGKNLVVEWDWIVKPTMVNNFAFNYSKGAIFTDFTGEGLRKNFTGFTAPEIFPDNILGALPAVSITGYASWGATQGGPWGPYFNTYGAHRIKDSLSIVKGKHTLKMGYLYSWEFKNEDNGGSAATAGIYTFPSATSTSFLSTGDAFANFLLGRATSYVESNIDIFSRLRYSMHEAYFQDDWKVLPNLTLNLGARWSYILPPWDVKNTLTNFMPSRWDPAKAPTINASGQRVCGAGCDPLNGIIIAGVNSPFGRNVTASHANTIGPRFGFAWDPWKDGKTAVRGGYGWYFDRTLSGIALQNAFLNPPFVTQARYDAATGTGINNLPTFANPAAGTATNAAALVPNLTTMAPDFKIPTIQQWSFGIQHELPWGMSLDMAYAGSHGTHLLKAIRLNQTAPGAATSTNAARAIALYRGYGTITQRTPSASSRYDSLQIGLNKKFSSGLMFGAAYTWGKVLTDSPDDRTTIPIDLRNLRRDRGLAAFDKNHVFVGNWNYALPFFKNASKGMYNLLGGWEFGGILRAERGVPLTMSVSGDLSNSFFGGTNRLDIIGDPNGKKQEFSWFNTAAFAFPAANRFGTSNRSVVRGPGIFLTDLTFLKNFKTTERISMQFRAEFFNALNHTNFLGVGTTADANFFTNYAASSQKTFGQITSTLNPREIQLGFRVAF